MCFQCFYQPDITTVLKNSSLTKFLKTSLEIKDTKRMNAVTDDHWRLVHVIDTTNHDKTLSL